MTSPCRSCVLVVTPSTNVPAYSLSSLMSKSWTFVPRPTVSRSKPVAMGSSVPQWPTLLISSLRRTNATTSCDVIPAALSTSRTPSGVALDCCTGLFHDFFLYFRQCPANARPGGEDMAATTKLCANRADIERFIFRAHADAHFSIGQFFEENGHDHTANCAQMIDQPFVVFRNHPERNGGRLAQAEPR